MPSAMVLPEALLWLLAKSIYRPLVSLHHHSPQNHPGNDIYARILNSFADVIMVWHAYQLNPRDFMEDCIRYGKNKFWRAGFPWKEVNACIDNETFEFRGSKEAIQNFESMTSHSWDSFGEDNTLQMRCPKCANTHTIPWTQWGRGDAWVPSFASPGKLEGEKVAGGLADSTFSVSVQCGIVFDHELLKTQRFRKDVIALRSRDIPMPGTILNIEGSC